MSKFILIILIYKKESILSGRIKVNEKIVDLDYKLKGNDLIIHEAIRKEPPVYNTPIEIIFEDEELLVINKPSSIPVRFYQIFNRKFNHIRYMFVATIVSTPLSVFYVQITNTKTFIVKITICTENNFNLIIYQSSS